METAKSFLYSRDLGAKKRPPMKEVSTKNDIAEREDEAEVKHPDNNSRGKG